MAFWTKERIWLNEKTAAELKGDPVTIALIGRCLQGEAVAFEQLYERHVSYIYRLAYGLLQHREDAEEVLQDVFEYAFRSLKRYDPHKSAFKTWLYTIAVSRCRNKRRRKWLPVLSLSQGQDTNSDRPLEVMDDRVLLPEQHMTRQSDQEVVWQALGCLSDKLRETAILRYYEEMTYQEIGEILGIPAKTAESRMRLAHKALRAALQDFMEDDNS